MWDDRPNERGAREVPVVGTTVAPPEVSAGCVLQAAPDLDHPAYRRLLNRETGLSLEVVIVGAG